MQLLPCSSVVGKAGWYRHKVLGVRLCAAHITCRTAMLATVATPAQWRERCYIRVMAVGRGPLGRLWLAAAIQARAIGLWLALLGLGCWERWRMPRPL